MTSLDLRGNDLHLKTGAELAEAFAAIPGNIREITLSIGDVSERSHEELDQIGRALSNRIMGVRFIDNDGNFVENKKTKLLNSHIGTHILETNKQLKEQTPFPVELIGLVQEYLVPATAREINAFVLQREPQEANQNFQLNCLIAIGISSAFALTALVIAITFPEIAIIAGITAAVARIAGLTSFGLYANNRWGVDSTPIGRDDLVVQP